MQPFRTSQHSAGSLSDAIGSWGVDCDLLWSPSHSDEESPPPVKRPRDKDVGNQCSRRPIAQSRYSVLPVCWTCDQYLWWLEQSRKAQKFLEEHHAAESGNRPHQLPSANQRISTVDVDQSHPRHIARGAECLSSPSDSDCRNLACQECACGFANAQSCPSKENHDCRIRSPGCQHACATLISEVFRALQTINECSKRLQTALEVCSSNLC